jgi:NAD(P)-dependent dehydrogenase (short-subunit alcohol dehydrogenase family)
VAVAQLGLIDLGLAGKRGIVSGAGRRRAGHGRLVSLRLAEAGVSLACIDIDEKRCREIVGEIEEAGGNAIPIIADMTNPDESERAVGDAAKALGGIDICVDIIGGARYAPLVETTSEDWNWTIENNLTQMFYLYRAAAKHLIAQGTGGSLVALASVDGQQSSAFHSGYGAAKAGVISLTMSAAEELGPNGIRVNAVAPGQVGAGNYDQPPDKFGYGDHPLAAPRAMDIANAVLFLNSSLADRITGQTVLVEGGVTFKSPWNLTVERMEELKQY